MIKLSKFTTLLAFSVIASSSAFADTAANMCSSNLPAAVVYEISSLALVRSNGGSLLNGASNGEAIENELCSAVTSYSLTPAANGYSKVTINYTTESCSQLVMLSDDGRVASTQGEISCQAN